MKPMSDDMLFDSDQPTNAPETQPAPALPYSEDVARLAGVLQAHIQRRSTSPEPGSNAILFDTLQAICLTLIVGPPGLGLEPAPTSLQEQAVNDLRAAGPDAIPEAHVCRLWLACAAGEIGSEAADELVALANEPLWEPVQALVYRSLAYFGRRDILAGLLPPNGPISLYQADAWLDATHVADIDNHWTKRLLPASGALLSPEARDQWMALLAAEAALACGEATRETENILTALLPLVNDRLPQTFSEAESRHIAARAAAALARLRVAQRRDDGGVFASPAGQFVPLWEREYLQALVYWQGNNMDEAITNLQAALASNPCQTPIRLALAALLASSSADAALSVLDYNEPTREMLSLQATLLARLGRYPEAENVLARLQEKPDAPDEPARYSWARGRMQYRQRACVLQAALAERRGNWSGADKVWKSACMDAQRKTLLEARQFFAAYRETKSLANTQGWKRDLVKQRFERWLHELGSIPLAGDAMFFRAVAVTDVLPERAMKDFLTLLRRRAWVDAEDAAGGGRIVCAGDALLRFGQIQDAIRAYETAVSSQSPEVKERLAVALVYAEVSRSAEPKFLADAADRARELAPASPWPQILAAMGLLMAREPKLALARLEAAETCGGPEPVCRCLRSLCSVVSGAPATMTDDELTALRLPEKADAAINFLCGTGPELARMEAFVRVFGEAWIAHCPIDPALMARRLLAAWCDHGKWDVALKFADGLVRSGEIWAKDLVLLMRGWYALDQAVQGNLEKAEKLLCEIER
jgi:tetratricopeptide (TPR) repeat protein